MFKLKPRNDLIARLKYIKSNAVEKYEKFEKKIEGTRVENWFRYWKTLFKDYKDVALDVAKEAKEKPTKAILIGSTFSLTWYCMKHNPTPTDFRDAYLKSANEVALVHQSLIRNETMEHIKFVEKCYNNDLLRYTSFGVFSFIWIDNHSNKCRKFETQCSYLQLSYLDVLGRILDIGFLDTWWILAKKMTDYDVNY